MELYPIETSYFNIVEINSGAKFNINQGEKCGIEISATKSAMKTFVVEEYGEKIVIRKKFVPFVFGFKDEINITMPFIKELKVKEGAKGFITLDHSILPDKYQYPTKIDLLQGSKLEGGIKCRDIQFFLGGGSNLYLKLYCDDIDITAKAGSKVELFGNGKNANLEITGGSNIDMLDFTVSNAKAIMKTGSQLDIELNGRLDADIKGGSKIRYYGNTELGTIDLAGGSEIKEGV